MARTIDEWKQVLKDRISTDAVLNSKLTNTSTTSIYNLFLFVVAFSAWVLENLFELFKADVVETIYNTKPHTAQWYVMMAKRFQYGYALAPDSDYYDNSILTEDQVNNSKIVKYAALVENPYVRLKVAKQEGSGLGPLSPAELESFRAYIVRIKDLGVKLKLPSDAVQSNITSGEADHLKIEMRVRYNPLVLNSSGARIDGTSITPVADGLRGYLNALDFNGLFSVQKMIDAIQAVDGVEDLAIDSIQTKYALLPYTSVDIDFIPDGGYLVIADDDLTITYEPA